MHLTAKKRLGLAVVAFVFLASGPPTAQAQERKPNVIVIFGDDVGWGDLGSYGGKVCPKFL